MTSSMADRKLRAVVTGIVVNGVLAGVKALAGVVGNSYALIADAVESISDIATSLVVYGGVRIAGAPPDHDHPYGHGKAEPLAGFIVAIAIAIAGLIIGIQSLREIMAPHHMPAPFTLIVLAAVVVVKEGLFRFVLKTGDETESVAVKADAWHHRSDALTSAAAFLGISIALLGGPGYESADDWAALFAAGIILYNAYRLAQPAVAEIMDSAPPPEYERKIRTAAASVEGVASTEKCFVRKVGNRVYADLHIEVDGALSVRRGHEIAHLVKDAVMRSDHRIADVQVHVEPIGGPRLDVR